jgi:hypothetical protein
MLYIDLFITYLFYYNSIYLFFSFGSDLDKIIVIKSIRKLREYFNNISRNYENKLYIYYIELVM